MSSSLINSFLTSEESYKFNIDKLHIWFPMCLQSSVNIGN